MCKFCESKKASYIMSYDNHASMDIYYGQFKGVMVESALSMQGNMLILNAYGSYRSAADCYYEDHGIDCDNKCSKDDKPAYIKIKYCPFCGKEIKSDLYDITHAHNELTKLFNELTEAKKNLNKWYIYFQVQYTNGDHPQYVTLSDIIQNHDKYKIKIYFGDERCSMLKTDSQVRFYKYCGNKCCSDYYKIDDDIYEEFINKNIVKRNNAAFKKLSEKRNTLNNSIVKIEQRIKELKDYLKSKGVKIKNEQSL